MGEPNIADVKALGDGEVLVVGSSAGETIQLAWDCDNRRYSDPVRVRP